MSLNIPDFILFYFSLFLFQILVLVYFNPPPLPLKKAPPSFPATNLQKLGPAKPTPFLKIL